MDICFDLYPAPTNGSMSGHGAIAIRKSLLQKISPTNGSMSGHGAIAIRKSLLQCGDGAGGLDADGGRHTGCACYHEINGVYGFELGIGYAPR